MRNPFYRFIVLGTGLFTAWYFLYEFFLHEHTLLDEGIIASLVSLSEWQLRALGYILIQFPPTPWPSHLGIQGSSGVIIGPSCDGIVLLALFTVFIVAYPGPWKHKFWFIPFGMALIHLLNSIRITALAVIVSWNEEWLSFNHDYTFTVLVYAAVFGLWWWWVVRFATSPAGEAGRA